MYLMVAEFRCVFMCWQLVKLIKLFCHILHISTALQAHSLHVVLFAILVVKLMSSDFKGAFLFTAVETADPRGHVLSTFFHAI